jgi:hypothetical protein
MKQFLLTQFDDGTWCIQEYSIQSAYPQTMKPNAREMIARLMQLVDVGPVAPQIEPEKVGLDPNQPEN